MKKACYLTVLLMGWSFSLWAQCAKIDSLRNALPFTAFIKDKVNIMNLLAENYRSVNELQASYNYARQAVNLAKAAQYEIGEARALVNQAKVAYSLNPQEQDDVISSFDRAVEIHKSLGSEQKLADTYNDYGTFYKNISYTKAQYLDSAAHYYQRAFDLYERLNERSKAAEVANNVAEVYFEKGEDDLAFSYSEISIESTDTQFSKAGIIKRFLDRQAEQQKRYNYILIAAVGLLVILASLLVQGVFQTRKANRLLQDQKEALALKNQEIRNKNQEIEKSNEKIKEAFTALEGRNKEIDKQYKQILLQQEEIEMRNIELGEKNEELKQTEEEIRSQRDNLEKQANEMAQQAEELQKSYETITILSRIGQSITSTLDFKEIFDTFYGYVTQLMPADGFRISEYHPEYEQLEYKFNTENQIKKPLIRISIKEENNPAVWCVKNSRSILINRKQDLRRYELDEYSVNPIFNSMIYYPMLHEGDTIGAVGVYSKKENAYNHRHIDMIKTLAAYTTIALKNAETYELLNAAQKQLVESEKMAALGNLVAGVAHEINTPIGVCVTAASRLDTKTKELLGLYRQNQMKRTDLENYLGITEQGNTILLSNLSRAADLVQGFKRVAVEQSSEGKRVFNLHTYLKETVMALNPELKNKPYQITLEADEEIEINSYAGAFSQIITNLVMNSLIHGFKGRDHGKMTIKAYKRYNNLHLIYSDDGNGMTEEVKRKIYEPFFTTNRDGGGTGLGMNIVYNLVVQKLGGRLQLESAPNQGATFHLEIPVNG